MSRIDFYTLPVGEPQARLVFACQLVERVLRDGLRVWVHGADEAQAATLDELLWSFRDASFVPHERAPGAADCPVLIGSGSDEPAHADVLVNLGEQLPAFHERIGRIAEIVLNDEDAKQAMRARWRQYRDAGHTLEHRPIANMRGAGGH